MRSTIRRFDRQAAGRAGRRSFVSTSSGRCLPVQRVNAPRTSRRRHELHARVLEEGLFGRAAPVHVRRPSSAPTRATSARCGTPARRPARRGCGSSTRASSCPGTERVALVGSRVVAERDLASAASRHRHDDGVDDARRRHDSELPPRAAAVARDHQVHPVADVGEVQVVVVVDSEVLRPDVIGDRRARFPRARRACPPTRRSVPRWRSPSTSSPRRCCAPPRGSRIRSAGRRRRRSRAPARCRGRSSPRCHLRRPRPCRGR